VPIREPTAETLPAATISWLGLAMRRSAAFGLDGPPIAYSGLITLVSRIAVVRWGRGARRILFWFYLAAVAVGTTGFWLHGREDPLRAVPRVLAAWYSHFPHRGPPALAPLSFCALGLVGMLACAERFQLPTIFASGAQQMAASGIPASEERRNVAHGRGL
jgi:hypothetical protein